ncbi:ExbD/TolR family protein [Sulfuriferula nivalis]|uniref:Transport-related membrane protein n=1 Tax=Sulfuriferula nivalis TaxID=2675298 RepID=A0A809RR14_9PROT|nr:biopolymer transporter ExbD [Sulfuriferula nivalis]BBP01301.1 transport-related membrane protein [Sulfuriferula nivalis]
MAFGGLNTQSNTPTMAEINMIPLIDVMLVLLVIFIITAPMMTNAVKIDLPTATSAPNPVKPETVQLSIDASNQIFWNDGKIDPSELNVRLQQAASKSPQPELQIRADGNIAYRHVAKMMADVANAGLTKIAFVTDPKQQ